MVRHTLIELGPKVLASRMVRDYTEKYYAPAAQSLRRTVEPGADGAPSFGAARELAAYRQRVADAWPKIQITDVDSYGLPDTPLLGSVLTLTATVQLVDLRPDEVAVQAVVGRVDASDSLVDPVTVPMQYRGRPTAAPRSSRRRHHCRSRGRWGTRCGCCPTTRYWPPTTSSVSSRWREFGPHGRPRWRAVRAGDRSGRRAVGDAGAQRRDREGDHAAATSRSTPSLLIAGRRSSPQVPTARCGSPAAVTTASAGSPRRGS